jgi:DNA-binding NtrC family response regulator
MTAQETNVKKSIVLTRESEEPSESAAYRLLSELGHEVVPVSSTDRAVSALQQDPAADLVVIDMDEAGELYSLHRLFDAIPENQQPRQVAVFSDRFDPSLSEFRRQLSPKRVHVFLKPLHLHGLLGLLRQIENDEQKAIA